MLKKLMEAEEKKEAAAAEEVSPPTEEAPAEAPVEESTPPEETPAEETPPADAPEETEETATEETPAEETPEETPVEKPKDESEKSAEEIEKLSQKQIVDDYDLAKKLKSLYEPILNADTLKEKTRAIRNYEKVINNLAEKSEKNDKVKTALVKTRDFIMADSRRLASLLFRKLKN